MKDHKLRPSTLAEVAERSESIEDFGLLLREWIHTIRRGDVSNRPALGRAIADAPVFLARRFKEGVVADAYLAAYAEWIADQAGIERPKWTTSLKRISAEPWFADEARASLLILSPASFRQRNLFTIPEAVVRLRRGRPRVEADQKRRKARLRDHRYRARLRDLIEEARSRKKGRGILDFGF